jgi:ABC-2 type transport system ATP-binding protein
VENLLTDVMFIEQGRIVLDTPVDQIGKRYAQLVVKASELDAARALKPFSERALLGRTVLFYENAPREQLAQLGDAGTPTVSDLFVARMSREAA